MLLYAVVTIFHLAGAPETEYPLAIFTGTELFTEQRCEAVAKKTTLEANALLQKRRLRVITVSFCKHAGVSI